MDFSPPVKTVFFFYISLFPPPSPPLPPPPHPPRLPPPVLRFNAKNLAKIRACRPCIKPDPAVNGKRRIRYVFCYLKTLLYLSVLFALFKTCMHIYIHIF